MVCANHITTTRADITFEWHPSNAAANKTTTVDVDCCCKCIDQLKSKFLEVAEINTPTDVVFSILTYCGTAYVQNGEQIYQAMIPEIASKFRGNHKLKLYATLVPITTEQRLATLEKTLKQVVKERDYEKNWRVMKDTEIAEDILSLHERIDDQNKQIKLLQKEMDEMKAADERRQKQEEERQEAAKHYSNHRNIHHAVCDQCHDMIVGRRFKCAVCVNYDLCETCEGKGAHPHHAMIRLCSKFTLVPDCLVKNKTTTQKQDGSSEAVPAITIQPPFGQTSPFYQSDYTMKLIDSIQKPVRMRDLVEQYRAHFTQNIPPVNTEKKTEGHTTFQNIIDDVNAEESDSDDTKSISSDSSDCSSDSSDSSCSSDSSGGFVLAKAGPTSVPPPTVSFETLSEILREIEEYECASESNGRNSADGFDLVDEKEEEFNTAVSTTPAATD